MEHMTGSTKKHLLCFCFFFAFPIVCLNYWWGGFQTLVSTYPYFQTNRDIADGNTASNVTILLWHWPFGKSQNLGGDVCWNLYHIPHCRLVDQRSLFPIADVVVFHNRELINGQQSLPLSLPRPPGQRWAWLSLESPDNNGNMKPFANIFNLTISYRRDADISIPYGEILPKKPGSKEHGGDRVPDDKVEDAVPQNKSTLVCWVVSNYSPRHRRSEVYRELLTVVPVEMYGKWNGRPLAPKDLLPTISRCYFYLAFENSLSKDYITEKLWWNAYQSGAVPVVLGASLGDYKAVAPPHSFLHVDEFASIKNLGKRLKELAKDQESYAGYLAWRHGWKVKRNADWREKLCKICSEYARLPQKVYTHLDEWMNGQASTED